MTSEKQPANALHQNALIVPGPKLAYVARNARELANLGTSVLADWMNRGMRGSVMLESVMSSIVDASNSKSYMYILMPGPWTFSSNFPGAEQCKVAVMHLFCVAKSVEPFLNPF